MKRIHTRLSVAPVTAFLWCVPVLFIVCIGFLQTTTSVNALTEDLNILEQEIPKLDNGKMTFEFTDENIGESLILKSNEKTVSGLQERQRILV